MMGYLSADATAYYGSQQSKWGESAVVTRTVNAFKAHNLWPKTNRRHDSRWLSAHFTEWRKQRIPYLIYEQLNMGIFCSTFCCVFTQFHQGYSPYFLRILMHILPENPHKTGGGAVNGFKAESKSELLYDCRFTANQFALGSSPFETHDQRVFFSTELLR
jgi:hypothetical protein